MENELMNKNKPDYKGFAAKSVRSPYATEYSSDIGHSKIIHVLDTGMTNIFRICS